MKILAFYLPQFHNIPENDEWWGPGFTEWTNVKAATPLFEGHQQPRVPLNNNYYNLLDDDVKIWQAEIAKKYGIYGFCYYHYWFDGKLLLEKPMEQMLKNPKIDLPFCICWANEPWTKIWVGEEAKTLIPQRYGSVEDWKKHFEYFVPFFKDPRYICEDGKPLVCIYRPHVIPHLAEMISCWRSEAESAGFPGLVVIGRYENNLYLESEYNNSFDYIMEWQPISAKMSGQEKANANPSFLRKSKRRLKTMLSQISEQSGSTLTKKIAGLRDRDSQANQEYDDVWKDIISMEPTTSRSIPGAFVRWDNSPRKHKNEGLILGETPEKFKKYLSLQIKHAKEDYHQDKMFMFAWNEWAEGGYLEPDEEYGYAYLEAIKEALLENDEYENLK